MKLSQVRIEMANQLEKLFIAGNSRHLSPQKMAEFIHLISQVIY